MTIPVTPQMIAEIRTLLKKRSFEQILKYDPNQPRNPSGTHEGGRWASGGVAGSKALAMEAALNSITGAGGVAKPPFKPPEYGFGSTEDRRRHAAMAADIAKAKPSTSAPTAPPPPSPANAAIEKALAEGVVQSSKKRDAGNTNATYKVTMTNGTSALYKPEKGEAWEVGFINQDIDRYVTNREFSLGMREAFAYQVGNQLFGEDNPVPVTVHRSELPNGMGLKAGAGGEEQQRQQYEVARQQQIDRLFAEAQGNKAADIVRRAKEMDEIWQGIVKDAPPPVYGAASQLKKHPVLPFGALPPKKRQRRIANALGQKKVRVGGGEVKDAKPRRKKVIPAEPAPIPFHRKELGGPVDPLEVLREAKVDVVGPMSNDERARVTAILRQKYVEGYQRVGLVDEKAARAELKKEKWVGSNEHLIQTFDAWKRSQGVGSGSSSGGGRGGFWGGGGGFENKDAPNPNGGSLQHWEKDGKDFGTQTREDGVRMATLDYLIGTMDRHPRNVMYGKKGVLAIDNGYSMPAVASGRSPDGFKFRSAPAVEWLQGDTKVKPKERKKILAALNREWKSILDRFPGMNEAERKGFMGRLEKLKKAMQTEDGLVKLWRSLSIM